MTLPQVLLVLRRHTAARAAESLSLYTAVAVAIGGALSKEGQGAAKQFVAELRRTISGKEKPSRPRDDWTRQFLKDARKTLKPNVHHDRRSPAQDKG